MNRILHTLSTLAAGVWLGGMVLIGPIVAKNTFEVMRQTDVAHPNAAAGRVMAVNFIQFDKVQLVCAGVLLLGLGITAATSRRKFGPVCRLCLAIAATGFLAYSVQFLTPQIAAMQDVVATAESDSAVRTRFDGFHDSAVLVAKINLGLIAAVLLSLGWAGPPAPLKIEEDDTTGATRS